MVASSGKKLKPALSGLRKGMLEFVLLRMIGAERLYVAEILQRLAETTFATQAGTLYPLLGKMRREGLVEHEWKESASGPPRKYYALTKAGAQRLDALENQWARIMAELDTLAG
jgi:PadR family transcriptional regulator